MLAHPPACLGQFLILGECIRMILYKLLLHSIQKLRPWLNRLLLWWVNNAHLTSLLAARLPTFQCHALIPLNQPMPPDLYDIATWSSCLDTKSRLCSKLVLPISFGRRQIWIHINVFILFIFLKGFLIQILFDFSLLQNGSERYRIKF